MWMGNSRKDLQKILHDECLVWARDFFFFFLRGATYGPIRNGKESS